jgi:DNA-binding transcriptional MerR regulator
LNISAAAQTIGVSPDTLRKWDERIPTLQIARDNAGRRRFDDRSLQLLKMVKRLSDEGRSFDTITAVIERPSPDVLTGAPISVLPEDARSLWWSAALQASRDATSSREDLLIELLEAASRDRENLEREVGAMRTRIADLAQRNDDLETQLSHSNERLERTELMTAVRHEPARRAWWKFW